MKVRPKKHLGQHFLTDLTIAKRISDAVQSDSAATTLEVGPGTGVLTQYLLEREDLDVYATEIDGESIAYLKEYFPKLTPHLMDADFLNLDLAKLFDGKSMNVVGNFPYNISSQIYFKILEYKNIVPQSVGMIQREVAMRIASAPCSREYGILSVFLQAFYNIEYLFTVEPGVFNPPPKVKSAVIRITRNNREKLDCNEELFRRVVKGTFLHRRKMIRNSITTAFGAFEQTHEFFTMRPEQLSVEQFVELTNFVENNLHKKELK